jgi:proteasome lid subunit RPN8/RPN11
VTHQTEDLILPAAMREAIIDHARDHVPRECCGVISGKDGALSTVHRLTNLEQGVDRYLFDDEEFFRVYWEIENQGEELLVVYHSHPVSVAYPSRTDVEFAFWPEAVYVICSLEMPSAPVMRGFQIVDGVISEVSLG